MFKAIPVAYSVPSSQSNIPLLIDPSVMTGWGSITAAEGQSIRFYADEAKTVELAREYVSPTEIWVKVGTLTSSTTIYADYDGVRSDYGVSDTYGRNNVWNGSYAGVWHLNESSGNATDSVSGQTLTNNNTVGYGAAKIGNGADYGSSNTNKNFSTTSELSISGDTAKSYSCWVNITTDPSSGTVYDIIGQGNNTTDVFYVIEYGNFAGTRRFRVGRARLGIDDPTILYDVTLSTNTWYLIHYTTDASRNQRFYVDGVDVGNNTATSGNGTGTTFTGSALSRAFFAVARVLSGKQDEARFAKVTLTANWIATEYNNQNNPGTFWGTVTDAGGVTPKSRFMLMMS